MSFPNCKYEGLLAYTLHVATEPMVELRSSSKIVPAQGIPKKDLVAEFRPGDVCLVTDRGERKLTGSYYTPDFIVKYMVDEALRPVLDEAVRDAQSDAERIQAVLANNVLDPSMGSGHFPVEATEYIARYLVELGVQPEETGVADLFVYFFAQGLRLQYLRTQTVVETIIDLGDNRVFADAPDLTAAIQVVRKTIPVNGHMAEAAVFARGEGITSFRQQLADAAGRRPATVVSRKRGALVNLYQTRD